MVEDKPHKPVKKNSSGTTTSALPLVLPDDEEGAMVTCCGAQEDKKSKGIYCKQIIVLWSRRLLERGFFGS